jgi:hypothetical protein
VLSAVAWHLGVPKVHIGDRSIPGDAVQLLPRRLIQHRRVLPFRLLREKTGTRLYIATADPANLEVADELAFAAGRRVALFLAGEQDLTRAIERTIGESLPSTDAVDVPEADPDEVFVVTRISERLAQGV